MAVHHVCSGFILYEPEIKQGKPNFFMETTFTNSVALKVTVLVTMYCTGSHPKLWRVQLKWGQLIILSVHFICNFK